jgi:23S rRNA (cytosine1962-C5)-methyltransferase
VFSVDQDADAIALARENFGRNGLDPNVHDFLAADVFTLLSSSARKDGGSTSSSSIRRPSPRASARWRRPSTGMPRSTARRWRWSCQDGLLVTASCSARVTPEAFESAVAGAGVKAGVDLTLVEERYQPPDHPIRLQFPEGRYLKFLVMRVTPW